MVGEGTRGWKFIVVKDSDTNNVIRLKILIFPPNRKIWNESTTQDFSRPSNLRFFVFDHHYLWDAFDDSSSVIMIKKKTLNPVSMIKQKFFPFSYSS